MATDIIARGMAAKALSQGGGGEGGTANYNSLTGKPSINGVELTGNKTAAELNIAGLDGSGKIPMSLIPPEVAAQKQVDDLADRAEANEAALIKVTDALNNTPANDGKGATGTWDIDISGSAPYISVDSINMVGKTIIDMRTELDKLVAEVSVTKTVLTAVRFAGTWMDLWNAKNTTAKITDGSMWTFNLISSYFDDGYQVWLTQSYKDNSTYIVMKQNGVWLKAKRVALEETVLPLIEDVKKVIDTPENHNGIYRGKDLTGIYTVEEIYKKVSAGDFSDLYLGDYITVSITTTLPDVETPVTESVDLMIAGFDYYWNCGDNALTKHHLVLIPRNQGFATKAKMNAGNSTEGGYLNSDMHQKVLPCYAASLKTALNNHLLSYSTWLTNAVTASATSMAGAGMTGAASGCEMTPVELQLMNEVQLYGITAMSSSAYDVGVENRQLPVFKFINGVQFGRISFWLRSVASSANFALCNGVGYASCYGASAVLYVRPLILFG